jgi:hypothetical protein
VHHADRSTQYLSIRYTERLAAMYNVKATGHVAKLRRELGLD